MANLYLKSSGGAWSAAATWSATSAAGVDNAGPPAASTDVILELASGNVTIDAGAVCRSIDCTSGVGSYAGTITGSNAVPLVIGDGTAGAGNVALKFSAGTVYNFAANSGFSFVSTSTTQQTVTWAGKTALGNITFGGVGGSWILQDAMNFNGGFNFTSGTFNTNGQTITGTSAAVGFSVSGALARTLTLGASTINLAGPWTATTITNLTVTANTATVNMTGAAANFSSGIFNWNGLTLNMTGSGQAILSGQATLANFNRTGTAVKTDSLLTSGAGPTITTLLTLAGNSVTNRLIHQTSTPGSTTNVTAAAVSINNVDFMDVAAAGAAIPWTGTSLGNALGNSNITFDTPVAQTRTGAGGNWSTAGNWTSRVPLPQDNVVVSSGASGTLTIDTPRVGANVDFTGFTGTLAMSTTHTLFGNWTLASGMTLSGALGTVLGGRGAQTFKTNGITTNNVTVAAPGGSYTMQDALTFSGRLTVSGGTFNSSSFNMTGTSSAATFVFSGTASVNLGTSTWTHLGTAVAPVSSTIPAANLSAASSTLVIGSTLASLRSLIFTTGSSLGTLTYTVAGSTGGLSPTNSNLTIGTLNFSDASNARTLTLTSTTTLTITNAFNVFGTAGKLITINSSTPSSAATLSKASGIISCDYLSIQDSTATGGASWYAGANSTSVSNVTGWIFSAPPGGGGGLLLMGVG